MIPNNKDLVDTGLNLLLYQFRDKFNIEQIASSYLSEIDKANDESYTLVDSFNIDNATGVYLDYIGRLVGEYRNQENDEDFRKRIKIRVAINNSQGTPNELLDILSQPHGS